MLNMVWNMISDVNFGVWLIYENIGYVSMRIVSVELDRNMWCFYVLVSCLMIGE